MRKHLSCLLLLLILLGCGRPKKLDVVTLEEYRNTKHTLSVQDRYALIRNVLLSSNQDEVLIKAMWDLVDIVDAGSHMRPSGSLYTNPYSLSPGEWDKHKRETMESLERLQQRYPQESSIYQQAFLTQARILVVEGKKDPAVEMYKTARKSHYSSQGPSFEDLLIAHTGWVSSIGILYELLIDDEYTDRDNRNLIDDFLSYMIRMKTQGPKISAVNNIYPNLADSEKHPEYRRIAEALCLISDDETEEALEILIHLDEELERKQSESGIPIAEYRNIPVYQAAAIYKAEGSEEELEEYLQTFWDRNRDRPEYVLHFASTFYHWRTNNVMSLKATTFFEKAGFFTNPELTRQVPVHRLTHIMDLHLQGHYFGNRNIEQAKKWARLLTEGYFPETAGSVNAMWILGNIHQEEGDDDAAEKVYMRIIRESPYDLWVNWSEKMLIQIWMKNREPLEVIMDKTRNLFNLPGQSTQERLEAMQKRVKELYR